MNVLRAALVSLLVVLDAHTPSLQTRAEELPDIDTKFVFKLAHYVENGKLGLAADVATTSLYPCAGFGIRFRQYQSGDTITVAIGGFIRPNPCFQTSSEAASKVFIGPVMQGQSVLRISYRGQSDLYALSLTARSFALKRIRSGFTEMYSYQ